MAGVVAALLTMSITSSSFAADNADAMSAVSIDGRGGRLAGLSHISVSESETNKESGSETTSESAGDPGNTANRRADLIEADMDAYSYGLTGYAELELLSRNLPKKSVAYVTQILDGYGRAVADADVVKGNYYRYALVEGVNTLNSAAAASCGYLGGITYDYFSEATPSEILMEPSENNTPIRYYVVSAETLLDADVIVTAGCISMDAMTAALGNRTYTGVLISDVPAAFADEEGGGEKALSVAYYIGCAYSEIMNPVDMCAFYYEYFNGISDRDKLEEKVKNVFFLTKFFRGYANTLGDDYDPEHVRDMIRYGTWFYMDNPAVFEGGAFDSNGMSSWEPDPEIQIMR